MHMLAPRGSWGYSQCLDPGLSVLELTEHSEHVYSRILLAINLKAMSRSNVALCPAATFVWRAIKGLARKAIFAH